MKVHPIPQAIIETKRSGFIQILHYCSVSWKTTPLYFCSLNVLLWFWTFVLLWFEPCILWTKRAHWTDFWVVWWKCTKFLMWRLKPQVSFSLNFASLFNVVRDNSSVLFQLTLCMIWTSAKFQTFDCSCEILPNMYFDRLWKYIKFQLKNYRGVMSHHIEEWYKIWRKIDLLFVKWQEFGKFWPEHLKFSKFSLWLVPFVQNRTFYLKKYKGVIFRDIEQWCKFWRKTDLWFGK